MKIKYMFLTILVALVLITIVTISLTSYNSFKKTEASFIGKSLAIMQEDLSETSVQIKTLHDKASSDLIFALQYPPFKEYFSLPETRTENVYNSEGVLQFTPAQRELKTELDEWIDFFQSRFPVEETCLIDTTGQEHTRLVSREIAFDEDLSSEEETAPFFEPSFQLQQGEVHVQYPYMSPDVLRWVFSYTSPVVLDDSSKPSFYHFEMPISFFQELVSEGTPRGRIFVLDNKDLIVADSEQQIDISYKGDPFDEEIELKVNEEKIEDYLPSIDSISTSPGFKAILEDMKAGKKGSGAYNDGGITYYVAYQPLPTFGWSIATIRDYDSLLEGESTLDNLKKNIFIIIIAGLLIGIIAFFWASKTMINPINKLKDASVKISRGNLDIEIDPKLKASKSEIGRLAQAFSVMTKKLKESYEGLEEKVRIKTKELRISNKLKDLFIDIMRHDLLNPAGVVRMNAQTVLMDEKDSKKKESLKLIENSSDRLIKMIENASVFAKLESGEKIDLKRMDLSVVLKEAVEGMTAKAKERGIKIKLDTKGKFPAAVNPLVGNVISNFISNAIKYGSANSEIVVGIKKESSSWRMWVADEGEGIPDKYKKAIFNRFTRLEKEAIKGSGLGLAIAKKIVELHNGKVWVEDNSPKGSVFFAEIPIRSNLKK
ncbi:MAG: HAMP domain-containing protein [Nanoarchaeota archaeon]|nr:HAMP domain-containing protein [Nanoarchaeota archaeon]